MWGAILVQGGSPILPERLRREAHFVHADVVVGIHFFAARRYAKTASSSSIEALDLRRLARCDITTTFPLTYPSDGS